MGKTLTVLALRRISPLSRSKLSPLDHASVFPHKNNNRNPPKKFPPPLSCALPGCLVGAKQPLLQQRAEQERQAERYHKQSDEEWNGHPFSSFAHHRQEKVAHLPDQNAHHSRKPTREQRNDHQNHQPFFRSFRCVCRHLNCLPFRLFFLCFYLQTGLAQPHNRFAFHVAKR